jgi:hypothetical protein
MIEKKVLYPERVRKIRGSFAFIEHRFLKDGFWVSLSHHELLLYLFLVLVADRRGLSYYSFDKICSLLAMDTEDYLMARNGLMAKNLIAFDGLLFQVLSLPQRPVVQAPQPLKSEDEMAQRDPATIHQIIRKSLGVNREGS